jgi:hypothetical protein
LFIFEASDFYNYLERPVCALGQLAPNRGLA